MISPLIEFEVGHASHTNGNTNNHLNGLQKRDTNGAGNSDIKEYTNRYTIETNNVDNNTGFTDGRITSKNGAQNGKWSFDTLQIHAGLETSPAHGQCTLPIYNSAAFRFQSAADADDAFDLTRRGPERFIYSRMANVSLCPGQMSQQKFCVPDKAIANSIRI